MSLPGLFVGRFQPFHLGHLDAIRQIFNHEKELIIIIGSAQEKFTFDNPFTAEERKEMVKTALKASFPEKKISIVPVNDMNDDDLWIKQVKISAPGFKTVYTGSAIIKNLFEKAGYKVHMITFNLNISGTKIRAKMRNGEKFDTLIPATIVSLIERLDGVKRIKEIK